MRRGVSQDQVNGAADAILGAGENPTVEKVRAKLGTGSPNTITRMLGVWRRQIGERLSRQRALPEIPNAVGQAMTALWRLAIAHAEDALAGRLADMHAALEAAQAELAQQHMTWQSRLGAAETEIARAQAARELAEHACATVDSQLRDSHALFASLIQQKDQLQALCDQQADELRQLRGESANHQDATADGGPVRGRNRSPRSGRVS